MRIHRFAIAAALAVSGALATGAGVAQAAPAVHASHVSATAFADTNGQPDPAPITLDQDIALAMCESSPPSLGIVDNSGTEFTGSNCADGTHIKFNPNGNTFSFGGVTYRVGTLNEPGFSPACLGWNGFGNVNRQNCSTGTGIIWGHGLSNGHDVWINRKKTQDNGVITVLAGSGSVNSVIFTATYPPASGVFERWGFA